MIKLHDEMEEIAQDLDYNARYLGDVADSYAELHGRGNPLHIALLQAHITMDDAAARLRRASTRHTDRAFNRTFADIGKTLSVMLDKHEQEE